MEKEIIQPRDCPALRRCGDAKTALARIRGEWEYRFYVVNAAGGGINAESEPGGPITVPLHTFRDAPSVDALALVLAHEMGHVALRLNTLFLVQRGETYRQMEESYLRQAKIPAGPTHEAQKERSMQLLGKYLFPGEIAQKLELEADIFAAHVASQAGYDLNVMATVTDGLPDIEDAPPIFSSHPRPSLRAKIMRCFGTVSNDNHAALQSELEKIQRRLRQQ